MQVLGKLDSEFYSALKENQLKMLEISGIDIKKVQKQQEETAAKMMEIAKKVGDGFKKEAPKRAEVHRNSILSHYKLQAMSFTWPLYTCYGSLEEALDCEKSEILSPSNDPNHAKSDVICDIPENICRPYLELHGDGSGVPVTGTVTCGLIFSFKDVYHAGYYRIEALVQANGYRLLQLWGGSCGNTSSTGHLKITVKMCVMQLFDQSWSPEIVLVDTTSGGPPDSIDLNRYLTHHLYLRSGLDADIKVEFKIDASIDGSGQCFTDLNTSEFFYFKVPSIKICRRLFLIAEPGPWRDELIPAQRYF